MNRVNRCDSTVYVNMEKELMKNPYRVVQSFLSVSEFVDKDNLDNTRRVSAASCSAPRFASRP